jgi:hypothetical protein
MYVHYHHCNVHAFAQSAPLVLDSDWDVEDVQTGSTTETAEGGAESAIFNEDEVTNCLLTTL